MNEEDLNEYMRMKSVVERTVREAKRRMNEERIKYS